MTKTSKFSGLKELTNQLIYDEDREVRFKEATIPISEIIDVDASTRPINVQHVERLAKSISELGVLIQPLAIDLESRLLAGRHRLAALKSLQLDHPEIFYKSFPSGLIPVHILDLSSITDQGRALAIEVAENSIRRNYTTAEVQEAAKRLLDNGYIRQRGRLPAGVDESKRLLPELSFIFGMHSRTVQVYLSGGDKSKGKRGSVVSSDITRKIRAIAKRLNCSEKELADVLICYSLSAAGDWLDSATNIDDVKNFLNLTEEAHEASE